MNSSTEKIYYENQYIKEFEAEIIEIRETEGKVYVVLDKTAFFPGGGGQRCDEGYIDGIKVIRVIEEDVILHEVEKDIQKLGKVKCRIDWDVRLDGMQQHLGQHVLSGCFFSLFNINTCGIHLGESISTVDLIGEVSKEQILEAEKEANKVIAKNLKVNFVITDRQKAKKMGLRRELQSSDKTIRVVEIENLDINACCGVHPSQTLELQMIKIKGFEKHKGNTRIYFLAGKRAVNDYLERDNVLENICNMLSSNDKEVINSLNNLENELKQLRDENNKIRAEIGAYEIKALEDKSEKINNKNVICNIYNAENMKYLTKIANTLTQKESVIVLFASKEKDRCNLLFSASKDIKNIKINDLLKDALTLIDGKGGGSPYFAQGSGKNVLNLQNAIEYVKRRIEEIN
ncbi:MAG: DHHA1 domain-containing protein [Clostridium sp.]|nr:DHHA1 domain-containing protein [Clostridium sp.]MDY3827529.1 DHHA1 domain-containing protein [Clostridium sp.]